MFGRSRSNQAHPGEIPIRDVFPDLTPDAFELTRLWVNSERSFVAVTYEREWPPELFGSLLVESIHTAASVVAAHTGLTEDEVLTRLWRGFDEERERLSA